MPFNMLFLWNSGKLSSRIYFLSSFKHKEDDKKSLFILSLKNVYKIWSYYVLR